MTSQNSDSLHKEIDSLAAEIVHAYEELHLLYELGDVLTSDLSVSEVSNLIVDKILHRPTVRVRELAADAPGRTRW